MALALDYTGRVAVVTGGTKGVGRVIAARLLEAGAHVVVCGRNAPAAPVAAGGREALFVAADVRDPDQAKRVVDTAVEAFARLDLLVNNAGGSPPSDAATASPRFADSIVRLNLLAPLYIAQAACLVMRGQETGGAIVNIASVSAVRPSPGTAVYGAAKAGLVSLTRSLGQEWAPKVRVNAIIAGMIRTEAALDHYGGAEGLARIEGALPQGRMAVPDDIAAAALFLGHPLAAHVTGAALEVHGGGERPPFLGQAGG
ncbi:SDR family oxidoreductase [Zavarzinia compransoris]|uniref:Short chain dehydrogenase n=1 Tax=Zavarzinia compransoris TaxID=1264899 RepID=A0A317DT84_9PROT|nr:SDR family oxidoreductase [Zavarzinia compransoris]PWR17574.1 short chain dehydrogenase [Zavarzinia compransoris]TDP49232.1 NAD(P)-dependent dehydrogenase (short-subunit alcohol dehydrogenase family) [Zavarzinia compransoris]